jgi:DNA polymerase-3 subunit delta
MVAVTAREAEAFVRTRFASVPIILFYGPDEGLVSERASTVATATTGGDAGNIVRIDGDELASDPLRLADEANAISMFGGMRAIRVKAGSRSIAASLEPLLATPPIDARIIIEAGDLKAGHALRAAIEKAKEAAAVPCYAEDGRDIGRLLDEMLTEADLKIEPEARQMVLGLLGADRRLSRMEIDKLRLYGAGKALITIDDVEAIMTEASQLSVDSIVDAAFLGQLDRIEEEARRLLADGAEPGVILGFALRHAFTLQAILRDRNGNESIKAHRINWKREKAVLGQLDRWNGPRLERVVQILSDAILAIRRQATLGEPTAIRALWSIALAAGRR